METLFLILGILIQLAAVALFCLGTPGKWYRLLPAIVLGCLLTWLISDGFVLGVRGFYGLSLRDLNARPLFRMVAVSAGQLLSLLGAWLLRRFRAGCRFRWLVLTLLFPFLSLLTILVIFFIYLGRNDLSSTTFFFCCVLEISSIAAVALIHTTQKSTLLSQEMALLHQQLQIQSESIVSLEKSYRAQRQATHDYQNQLRTVYRLLCDGSDTAARDYVCQLLDEQSSRIYAIHSGNPIVDAVAQQKCQNAREMGIQVSFRVNDLSGVDMKMNELVVLLSNLLDNAIEGCARCEGERRLECSILLEGTLFLSIRNTSPEVAIRGKHIPTSKEPRLDHGYGLPTIRRILDNNGAQYSFHYENGWFEFAAEIPNQNSKL